MPSVEKRALQNERRRWTEINQRGGRDDNAILEVPDTNGIYTNCWETVSLVFFLLIGLE